MINIDRVALDPLQCIFFITALLVAKNSKSFKTQLITADQASCGGVPNAHFY